MWQWRKRTEIKAEIYKVLSESKDEVKTQAQKLKRIVKANNTRQLLYMSMKKSLLKLIF